MCDWGTTVRLKPPSRCLTPNRIRNGWVAVDHCLVDVVEQLWGAGYATLSACCGHDNGGGEVLVVGQVSA